MDKKEQTKIIRFSGEILELPCEWENCSVVETDVNKYMTHVSSQHLSDISDGDLHCHWKDCEGFTETLPELRRHILFHAFHTKIKCYGRNLQVRKNLPDCSLSIQNRNTIPELPDPLVCDWMDCSVEFESPEYFYHHVTCHAEYDAKNQTNGQFECLWQDCNRNFRDHHKVKDHIRSHTQEKMAACPTCGGMFASRTKFIDHIQRQQTVDEDSDETFICEYCSCQMTSERLLRDHMRCHVNHYKCPYCDMTCPTPSGIQVHVAYRHSSEKPHACQYCEYTCKAKNDLRKHLETHSLTPSYKCSEEGCSYTTRSQTCYSSHVRRAHQKKEPLKYACHLCNKVCTRGNYLTKHLLNYHNFQWPSGHCRFRYDKHPDGTFRLQTVRYESLELSQAMMCDNAEDIDSPSILINDPSRLQNNSLDMSGSAEIQIANQLPNGTRIGDSVVYLVQGGNGMEIQCTSKPKGKYIQDGSSDEQEPVLLKILDIDESQLSGPNGSVVLLEMPQHALSTHRTVQLLTTNSSGGCVLETGQVLAEGGPLH